MTPDRVAALVARWVRVYTRGLPTSVAKRRIAEIHADLHDHITHERARGTSERRIASSILSRMVRGLPGDASWRGRHAGKPRRSIVRVALVTASILLVPLVAMEFTDEVAWSPADFLFAAALLGGTGLLLEAAVRRARNLAYRAAVAVGLAAAFLLVWINLAVGVIGEPEEPANAMYLGVLAVGIAGAIVARLRPEGMARALLATAAAQASVGVIALIAGKHHVAGSSVPEILKLNGLFAAFFAGSAWLFWRAARTPPAAEREISH